MDPADLWNLSVAASPALGALGAWLRARRARTQRARPPGPVLDRVEGVSDGARLTLSGRLLAPWEPTTDGRVVAVSSTLRGATPLDSAVEGLRLALDDGRTELPIEGALRVEVGAREAPPWGELAEVEDAVVAWVARMQAVAQKTARAEATSVRALCHGDRVLVRAKVEARPEEGDGGAYREARVRYVLVPDGAAVLAYGSGPRAPTPWRAVLRGAAVGLVAMVALLTLVGMVATGLAGSGRSTPRFDGERVYTAFRGSVTAARVAMVSPLERRRAHHAVAESLRDQRRPTKADLAAASEELLAAGDCVGAMDLALAHCDASEARRIDLQARCEGPRAPLWTRAIAAYAAGDYADASELFEPSVPYVDLYAGYVDDYAFDLRLHVLAGLVDRVSAAAQRRATWTWRGRRTTSDQAQRATLFECVARYGEAKRGDRDALTLLREHATQRVPSDGCALLYLDALSATGRVAAMTSDAHLGRGRVAQLLAWEAGVVPQVENPCGEDWSAMLLDPATAMERRSPGLEHSLMRSPGYNDADPVWRAQVDLRCSVAAFEALSGHFDRARGMLAEADVRTDEAERTRSVQWGDDVRRNVDSLRAVVEVMAGDGDAARRALVRCGEWSNAARVAASMLAAQSTSAGAGAFDLLDPPLANDARTGWTLLAAHANARLAEQLFTHSWRGIPTWVTLGDSSEGDGRAEVARWLDVAAPPPCVRCTVRRRLAELSVARRSARRWGTAGPTDLMLEHASRALSERRLAVLLRVLDDLRENARDLSW